MWENLRVPILRRVRQRVGHSVKGTQKAPLGYDMADRRQLEAGDSPRSVSLRHLAKFGEYQVIEKRPDRRANILFLVDVSASQSLGTEMSKRKLAILTVQRLGTACLSQGHAVSVIAFSKRIEWEIGSTASRGLWHARLAEMATMEPRYRETNPREAFERAWILASGSLHVDLICVVSDFLFPPAKKQLGDLVEVADVMAIPIMDPLEEKSDPFFGLFVIQDIESGERVLASGIQNPDPSRYLDRLDIDRCILRTDEREHQQFDRLHTFFQERLEREERRV